MNKCIKQQPQVPKVYEDLNYAVPRSFIVKKKRKRRRARKRRFLTRSERRQYYKDNGEKIEIKCFDEGDEYMDANNDYKTLLYSRTTLNDFFRQYSVLALGKVMDKVGLELHALSGTLNIIDQRIVFNMSFGKEFNKYFGPLLEAKKYTCFLNSTRILNFNVEYDEDLADEEEKNFINNTKGKVSECLGFYNEDSVIYIDDIGESDFSFRLYAKTNVYEDEIAKILKQIHEDSKTILSEKLYIKMTVYSQDSDSSDIIVPIKDSKFYVNLPFFKDSAKNILEAYSKSTDPILILQGAPGAGKTMLIRYFINRYRNSYEFNIIKNSDILTEEMFWVDLIRNSDPAAPHCLILDDCNLDDSTEFLTDLFTSLQSITGGLFAIDFKLIISTNSDISFSEAMIRRGRTFDILKFRKLVPNEILNFVSQYNELSDNEKLSIPDISELKKSLSPADIVETYKIDKDAAGSQKTCERNTYVIKD